MYNHLCAGLPLVDAVDAPRIHFEREMLNIEEGHGEDMIEHLRGVFDDCRVWPDRNFFFGGVHGAEVSSSGALAGAGDPRRGGIALVV